MNCGFDLECVMVVKLRFNFSKGATGFRLLATG